LVFGKTMQNILTLAKVLGLVGIIVAGFGWAQSNPTDWKLAEREVGWEVLAIILVLYAYGGWNDAAFVAAEVRNRKRNIPLALILGVGLITVVYLLVNVAYITGLGFENINDFNPTPVPARLLEKAFPGWGGDGMSILVMISALGAVNGLTLTGARIYPTLGNDYALFGWLGHWKPGKRAPILALLVQGILTLGMLFSLGTEKGHELINQLLTFIGVSHQATWKSGDAFQALVAHTAPVFWFFFMTTGFSLFLLREKNPNLERPFSAPLYPWLPIIFCGTCVFMLYRSTIYVGWRALFAIGLVVLGIPLFWLAKLFGGYRGEVEQDSASSSLRPFN
jgi:amino acid transporter